MLKEITLHHILLLAFMALSITAILIHLDPIEVAVDASRTHRERLVGYGCEGYTTPIYRNAEDDFPIGGCLTIDINPYSTIR